MDGLFGIVGAGVMGQAVGRAVLEAGVVERGLMWASARSVATAERAGEALGVRSFAGVEGGALAETGTLLLAVKPKSARGVLRDLREGGLRRDALVLSMVTGFWTAEMEAVCGDGQPVVRVMTNTPCLVGSGVAGLSGGRWAGGSEMARARSIFEPVAMCFEVDESHCDALTGLCGSGPAYVYLMMEALADGGVRVGLPRDLALRAAAQTMLGASRMVLETGRHPASLKDDVTTPAGCTIAALLVMEDGKLRSTLARAVEEATRTASVLAREPG